MSPKKKSRIQLQSPIKFKLFHCSCGRSHNNPFKHVCRRVRK